MSRFRLSQLAEQDLEEIWSYIAQDKPSAADRQIDLLHEKFEVLARNPGIGEKRPEFSGRNYRSFSVGNYVIYFRRIRNSIEIARVLHGARDVEAIL